MGEGEQCQDRDYSPYAKLVVSSSMNNYTMHLNMLNGNHAIAWMRTPYLKQTFWKHGEKVIYTKLQWVLKTKQMSTALLKTKQGRYDDK